MHFFEHSVLLVGTIASAQSAIIEHDWTIHWINANPDGRHTRPVIGVNGQWPNPTVRAKLGDTVRITAHNALVNETTSLHWHGIHQNGTNAMDGPIGVTQCPILPGQSFTYEFQVSIDQPKMCLHCSQREDPADRHILVALSCSWPVRRWPSRTTNH